MEIYYIVKRGGEPRILADTNLGAICEIWAQLVNRDQAEVIAVSDGSITRRVTAAEAQRIANFPNRNVSPRHGISLIPFRLRKSG